VSRELAALALVAVVHVVGMVVLLAMLRDGSSPLGGWWPGGGEPDAPDDAPPAGPGPPIGDARSSRRRLRGPAPLRRAPRRRRVHPPERVDAPARTSV
jgi:hypothetical protein